MIDDWQYFRMTASTLDRLIFQREMNTPLLGIENVKFPNYFITMINMLETISKIPYRPSLILGRKESNYDHKCLVKFGKCRMHHEKHRVFCIFVFEVFVWCVFLLNCVDCIHRPFFFLWTRTWKYFEFALFFSFSHTAFFFVVFYFDIFVWWFAVVKY